MPSYTTADIRNVLLVGHGGCGKTTLADTLLFESKTATRKGSVLDGSSFSDFEKEEKEHKHSIYPAVLHIDHLGKRINLIDAPGSPDLMGHGIACLPAVETVAVVVNAASGVEVVTRRMMEIAKEWNLPRAVIVNKCDSPEIDCSRRLATRFRKWRLRTAVARASAATSSPCFCRPLTRRRPKW